MTKNEKKNMYRFALRTLVEPIERTTLEAGPFTMDEAALFGQMEAANRASISGRPWVCNYGPVVEAAEPADSKHPALSWFLTGVLLALIALTIISVFYVLWRLLGAR